MELIKQLREKTGAGIGDCKKALDEAGNDLAKAVEVLRKKGIAKAGKRSDREAGEGIIKLAVNEAGSEAYMVEVNSETDFVARNERFQNFASRVLEIIKTVKPADLDGLLAAPYESSTVKEEMDSFSGIIGEKINLKRFAILISSGTVAGYSHLGGRIGALVAIDAVGQKELAYDIAMQVAAANPKYITPADVPAEETAKETEIYREQLAKEGKTGEMVEKIIVGKLNKYYEGICLTKQEYIKEDKQKVETVLGNVKVEKFIRFSL